LVDKSLNQSGKDQAKIAAIKHPNQDTCLTADTSTSKTQTSNARNYANSSYVHQMRTMGTAFSIPSYSSPEGPSELPKFPMSA